MSLQDTYNANPPRGIAGQLIDAQSDNANVHPMFNADTVSLPYGHAVEHVDVSATSFSGDTQAVASREAQQLIKLVNANTDKVAGLVMHSHATVESETLAANVVAPSITWDALKVGASVNLLRQGRIRVRPEPSSGVARGARLYVRAVAAGGWAAGSLRGSADGTNTIDCTNQGEWLSGIGADGLAELEVDFVNKGGI